MNHILTARGFLRTERRVASTLSSAACSSVPATAIRPDKLVVLVAVVEPTNSADATTTQLISLTAADIIMFSSNEQRQLNHTSTRTVNGSSYILYGALAACVINVLYCAVAYNPRCQTDTAVPV